LADSFVGRELADRLSAGPDRLSIFESASIGVGWGREVFWSQASQIHLDDLTILYDMCLE